MSSPAGVPVPPADRGSSSEVNLIRVRFLRRAGAWLLTSVDAAPTREGTLPAAPGGRLPTEAQVSAASTINPWAMLQQRDKKDPRPRSLRDSLDSRRR